MDGTRSLALLAATNCCQYRATSRLVGERPVVSTRWACAIDQKCSPACTTCSAPAATLGGVGGGAVASGSNVMVIGAFAGADSMTITTGAGAEGAPRGDAAHADDDGPAMALTARPARRRRRTAGTVTRSRRVMARAPRSARGTSPAAVVAVR